MTFPAPTSTVPIRGDASCNLLLMAIFGPKKCAREKMRLTNDSQTLLRLE